MERTFDTIVIGAGAAGLAAAQALGLAGRSVLVVEARGRLGGRIHTHRDPAWPMPVELGAEFVHGDAPATRAIATAARLPVQEVPERHVWARGGRWRALADSWPRFVRLCARIDTDGPDRSFGRFLARARVPADARELARLMVEGYHAAPVDDVSAHSLAADPADAGDAANRQYRLPGGYDGVVAWLRGTASSERVTFRLNTVVAEIRWSRGRVTVVCRTPWNGRTVSFRARRAVVALPVGILRSERAGGVVFAPALPAKQRALEWFAEAPVHKVVLRFRQAFWEDPRFAEGRGDACAPAYFHDARSAYPTWWTAAPSVVPLLTGWAGGPAAMRLDAQDPAERLLVALGSAAGVLGVSRSFLSDRLDGWAYHDWSADPYARGAYSYLRVGGAEAPRALARPVADTLFFAGEATSPDEIGTVSGALASGLRAAREVLRRPAGRRRPPGTRVARR
jgi:monoamine oxidase